MFFLAQARFAKGTKLTVIEPMLVVSRDGLRGMAVQAGEAPFRLFLETWNNQPSFQFLMIIYIYI